MGEGGYSKKSQGTGRGGSWGKGQPSQTKATLQPKVRSPQQEKGTTKTLKSNQCWKYGEVGHLKRAAPL